MAIDTIKSTAVLDGAIATADIADDAVTGDKLANDITIAGDLTVSGNDISTAGSMLLKPAGTEIVNINNTGDVIVKGQGSNRGMLTLRAGSNTANSQLRFGDQASDSSGRILYDHSDDTMRFNTNGSERFRVSASGIHLGGTGAANAFDDYEEGAWTPTTPEAGTMTNGEGRYIKVGHMVTIWCYVASISNTTSSNGFNIGGLPFTSVSSSVMDSTVGPVMIRYIDDNASEPLTITSYLSNASNILTFYVSRGNNDSYGRVLHSHFNNNNIGLRTQLSYEV